MTLLTTRRFGANAEIVPGISVEVFPGHTAQMMAVHIESTAHGGRGAACLLYRRT